MGKVPAYVVKTQYSDDQAEGQYGHWKGENRMTLIDKVLSILEKTHDGDNLTLEHH